jgi:DNA polymerase-3 subunit epsilon
MNNLKLKRPLVFFDLETTGLNPLKDRIVEITLVKLLPDGTEESRSRLIDPGVPIPETATAIHGITDDRVAGQPSFNRIAKSFRDFLEDCDLCGFNIKKFDIPMLEAEFRRAGVDFSRTGRRIIDTQVIFHKFHPRGLEAAYSLYCGKPLENLHSSDADARACAEILTAQLAAHEAELPADVDALHEFCCRPEEADYIDADGKLIWVNQEAAVNFSKNKGVTLRTLADTDPGFLEWIMRADFSEQVKGIVADALKGEFPKR